MYVLIILFIVALVYYMKYRRSRKVLYELSHTLPDAGRLPIIGQSHWFIGGPETLFSNIRTLYKKLEETADLTKVWIGPQLYIVPTDLDDIQKVLENCLEKDYSYKFLKTWLGNGLFVAPGRHFAMLAMKSVIATILRRFEVTAKPFDRLKIEILLFPVDGHLISIKNRT